MSDATLSSRIASALQQRGEDEVLFAHVSISAPASSTLTAAASTGPYGVVDKSVTVRVWRIFVSLLQHHVRTAASCDENGAESLSDSATHSVNGASCSPCCDVGVYCSDTFHTCLLESACLFLGLSFCPFRPDDPPLRLARLERRRRPRHKLSLSQIDSLLQAATERYTSHSFLEEEAAVSLLSSAGLTLDVTALPPCLDDTCIAYYMHTSGSTGDPKCVVASRGNLRAYVDNFVHCRDALAVTRDPPCRIFCLSSPFFDPSIGDVVATLCTPQSTFYTCSNESLLNGCLGVLLATARPTHVVSTPAVWRTVSAEALSSCDGKEDALTAPMKVFLGGERMSQDLIAAWAARVELYNIYGVTEATIYQSVRRVYADTRATDVTCGPGVGTQIAVDVSSGRGVSEGRGHADAVSEEEEEGVGEVVLYGEQVCCGYADEDQQPSSGASADGGGRLAPFGYDAERGAPFFRTGDVGKLVSDRAGREAPQLVLRGRRDWQMKLNGQRVSLEEVEGVVQRALEGVCCQCACFCVRRGGETGDATAPSSLPPSSAPPTIIGAAVVLVDVPSAQFLEGHREAVTAALQQLLALHLPAFMIPQRWRLYSSGTSLPQTATGKVNRTELARVTAADAFAECGLHKADVSAVKTVEEGDDALYEAVRSAWVQHLGVSVHSQTHYIHAGGDSLGALKLSRALYLTLEGGCGDDGIDEHGGLPPPFQPCVLLQHPRLGDYVAVLRRELPAFAASGQGSGGDGSGGVSGAAKTGSPADAAPVHTNNALLGEVVAAQCCGLAERLLVHGVVDVNGGNTREHRCVTPLHIAVSSCSGGGGDDGTDGSAGEAVAQRMVRLLLRHGAKPTAVTPDGVTPAHLAAAVSSAVLQLLLTESPALLHCRDGRQQSLLHFAARSGNAAAVCFLLGTYHMPLDTRDKWQRTAVHWAVLNGHVAVLEVMAAHHAASPLSAAPDTEATKASEEGAERRGNGTLKRCRRHDEGTARFARLARKKTYLAYETVSAIAQRTCPGEVRVMELCRVLSPAVGEAVPTAPV